VFIFHFKILNAGKSGDFCHTWSEDLVFLRKPLKVIHITRGHFRGYLNLITRDFHCY